MSTQTHHTATTAHKHQTVAEAARAKQAAAEVEQAFKEAARNAQWKYHHSAKTDPQGEQTERYRLLHAHAIEQWTAAIAATRRAHKAWLGAKAHESGQRKPRGPYMTRARAARLGLTNG